MEQHPLAFVPDKVQVVDIALVTLVKADLVLCPVVLELPVGWRGDNKMHRPVSEEVHLSAVAVDYGVMALQSALGCLGFIVGGAVLDLYSPANTRIRRFTTSETHIPASVKRLTYGSTLLTSPCAFISSKTLRVPQTCKPAA